MNQYVFFCQPNNCDQFTYLIKESPNYLAEKEALLEQGLIIEGDVILKKRPNRPLFDLTITIGVRQFVLVVARFLHWA